MQDKLRTRNMKHIRAHATIIRNYIMLLLVKEVLRIIGAKETKEKYAKRKFRSKQDTADVDARNLSTAKLVIVSVIKNVNRLNYCRLRIKIINRILVNNKCLRFSNPEIQNYVFRCKRLRYSKDYLSKRCQQIYLGINLKILIKLKHQT